MRILVAGSSGVVGRLLLPKLINEGHQVVGITRSKSQQKFIQSMGARSEILDVYDREAMMSVFSQTRPEVVIHQLTSLANRDFAQNTRIRIEGTRNLVDISLELGVSKMIAQSIAWAYEPGKEPAAEDVPLDIHAPMPRKETMNGIVALEQAVSEIPSHVILRYGLFYGPGTWYDYGGFRAQEIRNKQILATEGVTSFVHIEDAANAALSALDWGSGPVNIVDDEPARGTEWLPVYADAIGAPLPDIQSGRNGWERGASNEKARNSYNWIPQFPTWRTGFVESLKQDE